MQVTRVYSGYWGGALVNARGGFRDVSALRSFLNKDPADINSSRLITGMETILTAVGYRGVLGNWVLPPHQPQTADQHQIYQICAQLFSFIAPRAEQFIPDKVSCMRSDFLGQAPIYDVNYTFAGVDRAELSDGSDSELELESHAPRRLPKKIFDIKKDSGTNTWVGAAHLAGVPVRASVSGTVTLSLAATAALLQQPGTLLSEETAHLLAGVLFIPTYERGDYHSIAETAAGVQTYVATKTVRQAGNNSGPVLSPQAAFRSGLNLMAEATNPLYRPSMKQLNHALIRSTLHVAYTPN